MAKLLKQIWKTIQGKYFETEEEALEAERKANFLLLWREISKPYDKEYQQEVEKYNNARWDAKGQYPKHKTELPYNFLEYFYEKLKEEGLLATLVLSEKDENNS